MKKKPKISESIKLRKARDHRYKSNKRIGVEQFYLRADRDLLQKILRYHAPEKLPQRVGDNTHAELQRAFSYYMEDQWLGAWSDISGVLEAHHGKAIPIRNSFPLASTLTVDAIVILATRRQRDLQTGLRSPSWIPNAPRYRISSTALNAWQCGGPCNGLHEKTSTPS